MQPETYFIVAPLDDHDHDGDVLNPVKVFKNTDWVKDIGGLFPGKKNLHVWISMGGEEPKLVGDALPFSELTYCGQYFPMAGGIFKFRKIEDCPAVMAAAEPGAQLLPNKSAEITRIEFTARLSPAQKLVRELNQLKEGLIMLIAHHDVVSLNLPESVPKAAYLMLPDKDNKPLLQRLADLKLTTNLDSIELYYFTEVEGRLVLERAVLTYSEAFKKDRKIMLARDPNIDATRLKQDQDYLEGQLHDARLSEASFNAFFTPVRTVIIDDCSNVQEAARQTLCHFVLNTGCDPSIESVCQYITTQWPIRSDELVAISEQQKIRKQEDLESERVVKLLEMEEQNANIDVQELGRNNGDVIDAATLRAIAALDNPQPPQGRQNGRHPQPLVQPRPTAPVVDDLDDAETLQAMAASRLDYERKQKERHQQEHPHYYDRNLPAGMTEEEQMRLARERSLQEQHDRGVVVVGDDGNIIEEGFEDQNEQLRRRMDNVEAEQLVQPGKTRLGLGRFFRGLRSRRDHSENLLLGADIRTRLGQLADRLESLDMSGVTAGVRSRPTGFSQMIRDLRRFQRSRTEPTEAEVLNQLRSRVNSRPKMPACGGPAHRDPEITQGFYDAIKSKTVTKTLTDVDAAINVVASKLESRGSVPKK